MTVDNGMHTASSGVNVHTPYRWVYADSTARIADTAMTPSEVNKIALQLSDGTLWTLTDDAPITWLQTGGGGAAGDLDIGGLPEDTAPVSGDFFVMERSGTRYKVDLDNMPSGGPGGGAGILENQVFS